MKITQVFVLFSCVFLLYGGYVQGQGANTTDACAFQYGTISDYNACLNTIPLSDSIRTQTIAALKSYLDQYVFLDINKNSPPPYSIQCDPMADLNIFATKTYTRDFDFHMDLLKSVRKCKDAHTRYSLPQGYSKIRVIQPLSLTSALDVNGNQAIYVRDDYSHGLHDSLYGTAIGGAYLKWQVKTINGQSALQYLIAAATSTNFAKDPSVCFSRFLTAGFTEPQYLTDLPSRDTISYELINPVDGSTTKLELYYLVITPPGHSTMALVQSNANQGLSCSTNRKRKSQPRPQYELDLSTAPALFSLSGVKPLYQTPDGIGVFVYKNHTVLRISTFEPTAIEQGNVQLSGILYGIKLALASALQDYKAKKLIIDVRNNGGGLIIFAMSLLEHLFADWNVNFNSLLAKFPVDIRKSQFYSEIAEDLGSAFFADITTWIPFPPNSSAWYIPTSMYTRGGITGSYTQKFGLRSEPFASEMRNLDNMFFNTSDIVVLTNGVCVSSCSFFVKSLKTKVKIIAVGGIKGQPMDSSMSIGAPVQTSIDLFQCADNALGDKELTAFPTSANFAWPFAEVYDVRVDASTPAEFSRTDPDIRIDFWDEADQIAMFDAVIEAFDPPMKSNAYILMPLQIVVLCIVMMMMMFIN